MLIDTGSVYTLISKGVWDSPGSATGSSTPQLRDRLSRFTESVISANGDTIHILGEVTLAFKFGSVDVKHRVLVAFDLAQSCILGLDVLSKTKSVIDTFARELKIGGQVIRLKSSRQNVTCWVSLAQTVTIPGGHEMILPGRLISKGRTILVPRQAGIIEGSKLLASRSNVAVARVLVVSDSGRVPLRVANVDPEPVVLCKDTTVGLFESVGQEVKHHSVKHHSRGNPNLSVLSTEKHDFFGLDVDISGLSQCQKSDLKELLSTYSDVIAKSPDDIGRTSKIYHPINTGSNAPIRQGCGRLPLAKQSIAKEHIETILREGIISPSYSPWSSPIILIPRKDGSTRFCVDYRKLNSVTKKDAYPLPRIDQTLDALSGSTIFSSLDLLQAYFQVEVAPDDREKTAFVTNYGLYEFNVMPFGLCGAPSTFQRLMEAVLGTGTGK